MTIRAFGKWIALMGFAMLIGTASASATPISVQIGDDDGYGRGIANNGSMDVYLTGWDSRSATEKTATDGSQQTDVFGALGGVLGAGLPSSFDVVFPFVGTLVNGLLTIDMASFQSGLSGFGEIAATINGIAQPGMLYFAGGPDQTRVASFALSADVVAAANLAQQVLLHLVRPDGAIDEVAFDFFRLNGDTAVREADVAAVPEPATLSLLGIGLVGLVVHARRMKMSKVVAQQS